MNNGQKSIPVRSLAQRLGDLAVRVLFAGFVGLLIWLLLLPWINSRRSNPLSARLPSVGPRVPIPVITAATLAEGRTVYQARECS